MFHFLKLLSIIESNEIIFLIIVGPTFSDQIEFTNLFLEKLRKTPGVIYLPALPQAKLCASMMDCIAILNSSKSEGLSNAILEALFLGIPVVARNIEGNQSIIQHGISGFLFNTPEECVHFCQMLLNDPKLKTSFKQNGQRLIDDYFNFKKEENLYQSLIK